MKVSDRFSVFFVFLTAIVLVGVASPLLADPCLVVYQNGVVEYHYDPNEYYTVSSGHPLFDPAYDRGGEVLIEWVTNDIDHTIYQAPGLSGFKISTDGKEGYFSVGTDFELVVDGWNNTPTYYTNILVVFDPEPDHCTPLITIDGNPAMFDPQLGWYYPIGDLEAMTPTPDGNNYSDTLEFTIHFELCSGMRVWAFADEDFNMMNDGGECFTAFSHDLTVPVEETSWGGIKSLYQD
jgi:hypothetical protein